MSVNRGKSFEDKIKEAFEKLPGAHIKRLYDTMNGYEGVHNDCDFYVYKLPILACIECKSVHGNTLSIHSNNPKKQYGNISNNQWNELLREDEIPGVVAGFMVWFIDKDVTVFVPATEMARLKNSGKKSFSYKDFNKVCCCVIPGKKKRVFWEYDMQSFYRFALIWANKGD